MSEPCKTTIKINVMVYRSNDKGEHDVVMIDTDSFVGQLLSTDGHECSNEVQELFGETRKLWSEVFISSSKTEEENIDVDR